MSTRSFTVIRLSDRSSRVSRHSLFANAQTQKCSGMCSVWRTCAHKRRWRKMEKVHKYRPKRKRYYISPTKYIFVLRLVRPLAFIRPFVRWSARAISFIGWGWVFYVLDKQFDWIKRITGNHRINSDPSDLYIWNWKLGGVFSLIVSLII